MNASGGLISGQKRLQNSSVLVVGAGGLGCPALLYLAAAGVGMDDEPSVIEAWCANTCGHKDSSLSLMEI